MRWLWTAIAAAWIASVALQLTGRATLLHHHTLIEHGPPLWIAVIIFLLGWQVMVAAMMLPASMPTIALHGASLSRVGRQGRGLLAFIAAYAVLWSLFGLFAFAGDFVLHHIVDATPWLAARPWLIQGGVLGLAGAYQLTTLKRGSLAACRHPSALVTGLEPQARSATRLGLRHAINCLGSGWALMLLMFAEGFANLWWMVGLTVVMLYETVGRQGHRGAVVVGLVLLSMAAFVLVTRTAV